LAKLDGVGVLLITDGFDGSTAERVAAALEVLPAYFAIVQLRAKQLSGRALCDAGRALREVTRDRAYLVVNDRVDVARAVGADGVHLPVSGLPIPVARRIAGPSLWIGASTHSVAEATAATSLGADYLAFGPVWPTPSKASFGPAVGLPALQEAVAAVSVPVFALGGVDASRLGELRSVGARPACIRYCLGQPNLPAVARAAQSLR